MLESRALDMADSVLLILVCQGCAHSLERKLMAVHRGFHRAAMGALQMDSCGMSPCVLRCIENVSPGLLAAVHSWQMEHVTPRQSCSNQKPSTF